jgi:hypothetical protein
MLAALVPRAVFDARHDRQGLCRATVAEDGGLVLRRIGSATRQSNRNLSH